MGINFRHGLINANLALNYLNFIVEVTELVKDNLFKIFALLDLGMQPGIFCLLSRDKFGYFLINMFYVSLQLLVYLMSSLFCMSFDLSCI